MSLRSTSTPVNPKKTFFFATQKAPDITIFTSTEILTFNEELYAQVREEVKKNGEKWSSNQPSTSEYKLTDQFDFIR